MIRNNTLSDSGFGIYIGPRNEKVLIEGNRLTGNAEAIRLTGVKKKNVVRNNRIVDNLAGITIRDLYSSNEKGYVKYLVNPEDIVISGNNFSNNDEGNILNFLEDADEQVSNTSEESSGPDGESDRRGEKVESQDEESVTASSSKSGTDSSASGDSAATTQKELKDDGADSEQDGTVSGKNDATPETSGPEGEKSRQESSRKANQGPTINWRNPFFVTGVSVVGVLAFVLALKGMR